MDTQQIEKLKQDVAKKMGLRAEAVHVSVEEIRKPELDAYLIAESVAQQLERRIMFRRAMKRSVQNAMRIGAGGIKIQVSGRLNGGVSDGFNGGFSGGPVVLAAVPPR